MNDRVAELFSELSQICEQYKNEVPGKRRAWPKSIKERIFELQGQGVNAHQIAKKLPIPYATLMSWNVAEKKSGRFLPVKVVRRGRPPTVTVGSRQRAKRSPTVVSAVPTVTVVTPDGLRILGLPVVEAMKLLGGR